MSTGRLRPSRQQWLRALMFFATGIVVFVVILVLIPHSPPRPLDSGRAAPALSLDDTAGGHRDVLADNRGRQVVVEFFATTCPTCQAQAGHLCDLARAHPGVRVYAVDAELESAQTITDFQRSRMAGCPVTFLVDPGDAVTHAWSVAVVPTVYVLGKDGRISYGGIGGSGIDGLDGALQG